ncbi:GNAT family N-acetyltransferase [Fusibacter paucivorans]|uniref:GNAT family N-acetyltransferase n=1 Tax=Fusibacter paucivorans TaxID=76009 RepID=A0ABS5PLZ6_9FIRM|nr:GNAT family N-acetyltransferase [Fusibacter paucivorans]MBS7525907.1 GNAT family N-acetyltransferase [Fusibacter paucivorans]
MAKISFRKATRDDVALILYFIKELAAYEHLLDAVEATEAGLEQSLFDQEAAEVIFVEYNEEAVGFALFFQNYSTFVGGAGIYLEDLYVLDAYRGKGLGKMLLQQVAKIAVARHCGRFEWACLNWNEPSIAFYKHMGAVPMSDWTVYRITGQALQTLSEG